jgi:hypothetical protein
MSRLIEGARQMNAATPDFDILEDTTKLVVFEGGMDLDLIAASLRKDLVVLVKNLAAKQADEIVYKIAHKFGLSERLELQAGFAEFYGHRRNIGRYFMSVNSRAPYQFISPHSEGASSAGMQLDSFYCYENSTDGGETVLINVDGESSAWQGLKELVTRVKSVSRRLSPDEAARARALYGVRVPADTVRDDDRIISEMKSAIRGLDLVEVLAEPVRTYSCILDRDLYALWDSVGTIDHDVAFMFAHLLRRWGLLKEPPDGFGVTEMDCAANRRLWRSGFDFARIFKSRITRKLSPKDLVIQNNLTWTHAVANWSPDSGTRNIAAAFA